MIIIAPLIVCIVRSRYLGFVAIFSGTTSCWLEMSEQPRSTTASCFGGIHFERFKSNQSIHKHIHTESEVKN